MGKVIRVTPEELERVGKQLQEMSKTYTGIYTQLLQESSTMGAAWEGADNQAFVQQINGFTDELRQMATKLETAGEALLQQKTQYQSRQEDNIAQVQRLTN